MAMIWTPGDNPRNLPPPPQWWQRLVWDYDKMLRVLPGHKDVCYRLCRLVRREARLGLQQAVVHEHPDTVQMIRHGMVPVATLSGIWSAKILEELKARDLWQRPGAQTDPEKAVEAAIGELDTANRQAEAAKDRAAQDELDARSADAFRHVQYVKGERVPVGDRYRGAPPLRGLTIRQILDRRRQLAERQKVDTSLSAS